MKKAFIFISLVLLLASCISTKKHQASLSEIDALKQNVVRLQNTIETLEAEKAELKGKLQTSQDEKTALEEKVKVVENDKIVLTAKLVKVEEINAVCENQMKSFEKTSNDLQKENAGLKTQINELTLQRELAVSEKDKVIAGLKGTYDELLKEMKKEIESGQITITQLKDKLSLTLVEKVLFDSGSAEIKKEGKKILERVGEILKQVRDKQINVEGHTDMIPISSKLQQRFATNWELSTSRATIVVRYLQKKVGLDPQLLNAAGFASYRPVDSNETEEGRSKNRRIEIILTPMGSGKTTP